MDEKKHYMYVVECADGTLYTGYTTDVDSRVRTHNLGKGAKYTRARRPVRLRAAVAFDSKEEAMSAEYRFKRLSRAQKLERLARIEAQAGVRVEARDDSDTGSPESLRL